ncbi:MAG: tRNA (adenosine(37)-N6)-threonylcarbamoyltransferase complex transferase subunit TsaD [Candidatus Paceibacterota bacterium]
MKILSIETSCDDTGVSILEVKGGVKNPSFRVLANNLNSQVNIHIPYGGVFPVLAKREHAKNLPILLEKSLKQVKLNKKEKPVDAIAVTYGPGLEMCLWEGITFAKDLVKKWNVPLIPTNHMEGHILSVFGKNKGTLKIEKLQTPTLALLISGGHTQLVLMKKWMDYEIIGETLDDAVGEAFDKVARMLDLPYPGGPQISKLAEKERLAKPDASAQDFLLCNVNHSQKHTGSAKTPPIALPRPMLRSKNFDFSFSGLKTAVLYLIRDLGGIKNISEETKSKIALEFENAAMECLVYKTAKAIETYKVKTLIVAGGVSANKYLRNEMSAIGGSASGGKKIKIYFPPKELSGDNSIMIGIAGYLNYIKNKKKFTKIKNLKATGGLRL